MTWIQKQTSFRCSLARSFPHKLELLSILISEISDERIGKQPAMDLSRDKNAEEMKWSPLEMGAAMQAHGA